MRALTTIAFGALALVMANFATAAPAAAKNVGVHVGPDGLAISVSDQRYARHYHYPRRACRNRVYRYHHPRLCHRVYKYYKYKNRHYKWKKRRHHRHDHYDRYDRRDKYHRRHHRRHDKYDRRYRY